MRFPFCQQGGENIINIFYQQLDHIGEAWVELYNKCEPGLEKNLALIHKFQLSLLFPHKFSLESKQDLVRAADQLGYKPTDFVSWWYKQNFDYR